MKAPETPGLRTIVGAYTVNRLGTWFGVVAISLAVNERTHSALAVAAVLAVPMLPALLAPAVVARVEASSRRGALTLLFGIEALVAAGLAGVLWRFSLPGVLALVALDGGVAYAANALIRSEAARAGRREDGAWREPASAAGQAGGEATGHDHRANATLNVVLALTGVAGPALAGVAVHGLGGPRNGGPIALLIDAGSFLACGAMMLRARPFVEEVERSVRARLAAARAHIGSAPRLRALLVTEAVAFVFFTCALPVEVPYAESTLHAGPAGYGLLLAVWGVGMVAGSLLFARAGRARYAQAPGAAGGEGPVARRLWSMTAVGALAVGVAYVGFAAAPSLRVACLAALVGGIGNGVQWAAVLGTVQQLTPSRLHGRMMGAVEALGATAPVAGFMLGGLLASASSPRVALLAAGVGASATALAFRRVARLPVARPAARGVGRFAQPPPPAQPQEATTLAPIGRE